MLFTERSITVGELKKLEPCKNGFAFLMSNMWLLKEEVTDYTVLTYLEIVESNGWSDLYWLMAERCYELWERPLTNKETIAIIKEIDAEGYAPDSPWIGWALSESEYEFVIWLVEQNVPIEDSDYSYAREVLNEKDYKRFEEIYKKQKGETF